MYSLSLTNNLVFGATWKSGFQLRITKIELRRSNQMEVRISKIKLRKSKQQTADMILEQMQLEQMQPPHGVGELGELINKR